MTRLTWVGFFLIASKLLRGLILITHNTGTHKDGATFNAVYLLSSHVFGVLCSWFYTISSQFEEGNCVWSRFAGWNCINNNYT